MKMLEDLPPWVLVAFVSIVVLFLMLRGNSAAVTADGTADGMGGPLSSFTPSPADPNVIAEMGVESGNRVAAFQSLVDVMGAEEVSRIQAARDQTIAGITADTVNRQTSAAEAVSRFQSETARLLGLAQTDADLQASIEATHAASSLGLAQVEAQTQQIKTQAAASVTNMKTQSKTNVWTSVVNGLESVAHFFF